MAARSLVQVAAIGGHVADLRAGARKDGRGEQGVALGHKGVGRRIGIGYKCAKTQPAIGPVLDMAHR